jgi:parallel beta-helix repeat protein
VADQISIQLAETIVSAGSAVSATVNFRTRSTAAASTPTSIRYRVDCLTTGRQVIADTSVSAASSVSITIPGPNNGTIDDGNDFEERQLTVTADYGLSTQVKAAQKWRVRNIRSYALPHTFEDDERLEPYYPISAAETAAGLEEADLDTGEYYGHVSRYGTNTTPGTTDMTAAIQAAIDSNSEVFVPAGDFAVTSLKLNGTNSDRANITIRGVGKASIIRQLGTARASSVPGGDTTQSPNVIQAFTGSGFTVSKLRIIGNKDSGGVKPAAASSWVGATLYTYDAGTPTYVQVRANGTALGGGAELSTDLVYVLTATHTSDATDIDNDLANWTLVTNFAALNGYYYDESFNRGMCLYFGGPNGGSEVEDVLIEGCRIEGAYYANVLCGSGPEKTGLIGAGCRTVRVVGNYITNSSAGIGGLLRHDYELTGNTITGVTGNGINADRDGSNGAISGNVIIGDDTEGGRNGISSYRSDHIVVTGNFVQYFGNAGINFQDQSNASDLAGAITGNTIVDCGEVSFDSGSGNTGIVVSSSDHVAVSGNHIRNAAYNGIKIDDSNGVAVTGNTVYESGAYGINFEDCVGICCVGNNVRTSGRDNFYFEGCRGGTISGNNSIDGNTDDSVTLYSGFRIGPLASTESVNVIFTGNYAADTRTPRRQHYGLNIESATTGLTVVANDFTTNKTGAVLNNGSSNGIGFNDTSGSGSLITNSTIRPGVDNTLDLGATSYRFQDAFARRLRPGDGTPIWTSGAGTPESAVTGPIGSLYTRTDGGAATTLYVKESGAGNTGWVAYTA